MTQDQFLSATIVMARLEDAERRMGQLASRSIVTGACEAELAAAFAEVDALQAEFDAI